MRIAVDIDDTLNIVDRLKYAKKYVEKNRLPYRLLDPCANEFVKVYDWEIDEVLRCIHSGGVKAFTKAKAKEGAREALLHCQQQGHEIIILTSRRPEWFGDPEAVSRRWLKKNKIPFNKLIVNIQSKIKYCHEHGIDVLIDDHIENFSGAKDYGIKSILFLGEAGCSDPSQFDFCVQNWAEAERAIKAVIPQKEGGLSQSVDK